MFAASTHIAVVRAVAYALNWLHWFVTRWAPYENWKYHKIGFGKKPALPALCAIGIDPAAATASRD